MKKIFKSDSHIHTRNSDGYDDIDTIISMAEQKELSHIAVTDHDTFRGYDEIHTKTTLSGIKTVKSIEISAIDPNTGKKIHLLGYNIKEDDIINRLCGPMIEQRNEKARRQIKELGALGYDISYEQLYEFSRGYIFKQHIFDVLYKTGQTEAMFPHINETLFKNGGKCQHNMEYIDIRKALRAVKDSGGYSVIAHPGQQDNLYIVDELVKEGLDGLELNHVSNSEEYKKQITEKALKYGLILTGGSDYHGIYSKRDVNIGEYLCEHSAHIIFQ
ncbi:PHP domain-containing protein [Proteocatella sphenisci]|uniref:PHP domain-containing protein n=1 Tax=Proteocatella sphenisci TaxID=181070 RepID=UPI0004BCF6E3|nr:PHP domain-containing protein [Proteocatella sphenisci]